MDFQRGVYSEIVPDWIISTGDDDKRRPGQADIRPERMRLHRYQRYLFQVLLGRVSNRPEDRHLFRAVALGAPVSLCPAELANGQGPQTFVPILQRVGDDRWQLGLPGQGRYAILMGSIGLVLQQVKQLYFEWVEAEMIGA